MIKILLEHGADKKATVEDLYHPVDLLSHDRSKAKDFLKLSQFERKHCSSSGGSSDNESPTPPSSAFNHLDESSNYSTITPSPEGFPMYRQQFHEFQGVALIQIRPGPYSILPPELFRNQLKKLQYRLYFAIRPTKCLANEAKILQHISPLFPYLVHVQSMFSP